MPARGVALFLFYILFFPPTARTGMVDFSLFFFSNYDVDANRKYHLLLEAVRYADKNGFNAVWTPERHFHEFGGLFPNPSVISAALAMITDRIELRSGSVVSPLHDAVRIAEEWSVVDNLSKGRVALSFASGWNGNDFALRKENYQDRHRVMYEQIELVKKLWQGGSTRRRNGVGREISFKVFPTPRQKELPVWITAAGNEHTYRVAGEKGAHLLTHLLGQNADELAAKIKLYREGRVAGGYPAESGKVALMLHTHIGENKDEVMKTVEKPFIDYLRSATGLSKIMYEEAGFKSEDIPEADKELMLKHSFLRYSETAALIGTVKSCVPMLRKLKAIGVDEIACLVDFGIEPRKVIEGLRHLKALRELAAGADAREPAQAALAG